MLLQRLYYAATLAAYKTEGKEVQVSVKACRSLVATATA
jgi:hypothetical protein